MRTVKVKYIGNYEGTVPWCGLHVVPNEVKDVPDDIGKQLLTTGQFEEVQEEVKHIAKTSSNC